MASFIAWRKEEAFPDSVKEVFHKKGFSSIEEVQVGAYRIAFCKKQLLSLPCFYQEESFSLLVMGSVIIPHVGPEEMLERLVARHRAGHSLDSGDFLGNYLIVLFEPNQVRFYTDQGNGYSLYFHHSGLWSDSQLAMVHALHAMGTPTRFNNENLATNLSIGFLFGEKTIFTDILRFDDALHTSANEWSYEAVTITHPSKSQQPSNYVDALQHQENALREYFQRLAPTLERHGAACGITGGLDSRLLAAGARHFAPNAAMKGYTNTQHPKSEQVRIAEELSNELEISFQANNLPPLCSDISSNLYFNDGILRIYQIWLEEAKSRSYLDSLFSLGAVLLTGVGGEQYRNSTYTPQHAGSFTEWFKCEFIRKPMGKPFARAKAENMMLTELHVYVQKKLHGKSKEFWTRNDAEHFLQRVFNPAVRLVRNNIENQLSMTLSPFCEANTTQAANDCLAYTQDHLRFEVDLIRKLAPQCDSIPLDYGFKPSEPILGTYSRRMQFNKWIPYGVRNVIYGYARKRKQREPHALMKLSGAHEALEAVRALRLDVDVEYLIRNELTAPLVFELGFLILTLNDVVLQHDSIH